MATKKKEEVIEIRPLQLKEVTLKIVGDTPLIMHAWSEKAKREMLTNQTGGGKTKKKDPKNPVEDFINSMYWMSGKPDELTEEGFAQAIQAGAKFGFPVTAFKQAGNSAAYRMGWVKNQTGLRGAYFIKDDQDGLVEIHSDSPVAREDMVRIGNGTADIRYRGEFNNWWANLTILYNESGKFKLDDIINVINAGGFFCGVGEWRPEKDGTFGQYHVAEG